MIKQTVENRVIAQLPDLRCIFSRRSAKGTKFIRPVPKYDVIYPYDAASNPIERTLATAVNFDTLVVGAAATYGYNRSAH